MEKESRVCLLRLRVKHHEKILGNKKQVFGQNYPKPKDKCPGTRVQFLWLH
uniref:Unc-13 homolog C n=1 Tax=Macaca fascicularis TaxID=9541 RepID=I7G9E6_MACFA|nr:unnamed protein product [Macaca fascicularis]